MQTSVTMINKRFFRSTVPSVTMFIRDAGGHKFVFCVQISVVWEHAASHAQYNATCVRERVLKIYIGQDLLSIDVGINIILPPYS